MESHYMSTACLLLAHVVQLLHNHVGRTGWRCSFSSPSAYTLLDHTVCRPVNTCCCCCCGNCCYANLDMNIQAAFVLLVLLLQHGITH
jgi:hypothetical protein